VPLIAEQLGVQRVRISKAGSSQLSV
jgi:hypothetical protein